MFATIKDGDYYVRLKVIHHKEAGIVFLHRTRYINEVLKLMVSYVRLQYRFNTC